MFQSLTRLEACECARVQFPDQAEGRCKDRPSIQIQHDCTFEGGEVYATGGIDRMRDTTQ